MVLMLGFLSLLAGSMCVFSVYTSNSNELAALNAALAVLNLGLCLRSFLLDAARRIGKQVSEDL